MADIGNETTAQLDYADKSAPPVNRRRLANFFVKPKYQLRYTNLFVGGGLVGLALTALFIQRQLAHVDILLSSPDAISLGGQAQIYDALSAVALTAFGGFAAFVVYACVVSLVLSHRVSGPMMAIVDYIAELEKGNFSYERRLRQHDELQPIRDALGHLAIRLQQRD